MISNFQHSFKFRSILIEHFFIKHDHAGDQIFILEELSL